MSDRISISISFHVGWILLYGVYPNKCVYVCTFECMCVRVHLRVCLCMCKIIVCYPINVWAMSAKHLKGHLCTTHKRHHKNHGSSIANTNKWLSLPLPLSHISGTSTWWFVRSINQITIDLPLPCSVAIFKIWGGGQATRRRSSLLSYNIWNLGGKR